MRRLGPLPAIVLALTGLLLVQYLIGANLGLWISDQGRDALWARAIAEGRATPARGPAAGGVEVQGPVYHHLMAVLWRLDLPGWRLAPVLAAVFLLSVVLSALTLARHAGAEAGLAAAGLCLAQALLAPLFRTATNPFWTLPLGALALWLLAGVPTARTRAQALLRLGFASLAWMIAVQCHLVALMWAPALGAAACLQQRGRRLVGLATVGSVSVAALVVLMGGGGEAVGFVRDLLAARPAPATPVLARVASWWLMPARMAQGLEGAGLVSPVGAIGVALHWVTVVAGAVACGVRLRRLDSGPQRFAIVLLLWAAGGLLLPLPLSTVSFYYLAAGLPALWMAAGWGLTALRGGTLLIIGVLALANLSLFELDRSARRGGEVVVTAGSLWWTGEDLHLPTVAAVAATSEALAAQRVSYPCAVASAHGRAWVAAMLDGGVLASHRLLGSTGAPCRELRVVGSGSSTRVEPLESVPGGWAPAADVPFVPRTSVGPSLRPFLGEVVLPADGRPRRLTLVGAVPAGWDCGPLRPLGLGRWERVHDGLTTCRIVGRGEPVWIDVEPLTPEDAGMPPGRVGEPPGPPSRH